MAASSASNKQKTGETPNNVSPVLRTAKYTNALL
jgi:hypothetical protein